MILTKEQPSSRVKDRRFCASPSDTAEQKTLKILVYDAGVLGSLYATRLHQAGHDVTVLDRGERLAELRSTGIMLEDAWTGRAVTAHVRVVEHLEPDDAYDLVIVPVRKNQLIGVLPELAANKRTPDVLFMVNNAAGPEAMIKELGATRVILGFPGAGGIRKAHIVSYVVLPGVIQPTTIGELDGRTTPRLRRIARVLRGAGFPVAICPPMDAWQKTHVAWVSPVANALYLAGGDNVRLSHTRDGIVLMIRAMRENFRVLRVLGVPITPTRLGSLLWVPEPLLVAVCAHLLRTRLVEVAIAPHARAARDEMQEVAEEFRVLARSTSVPTPCAERLIGSIASDAPRLPQGSKEIPLQWRGILQAVGLAAVVAAGIGLLRRVCEDRGPRSDANSYVSTWEGMKTMVTKTLGRSIAAPPKRREVMAHVRSGVGSMHVTGLRQWNGDYLNELYGRCR